jgi:hypothetical protein
MRAADINAARINGAADVEIGRETLTSFWGRIFIDYFLVAPSHCVSTAYPKKS